MVSLQGGKKKLKQTKWYTSTQRNWNILWTKKKNKKKELTKNVSSPRSFSTLQHHRPLSLSLSSFNPNSYQFLPPNLCFPSFFTLIFRCSSFKSLIFFHFSLFNQFPIFSLFSDLISICSCGSSSEKIRVDLKK